MCKIRLGQVKNVKIREWNVTGLKNKLEDSDFLNVLYNYDVCFLN